MTATTDRHISPADVTFRNSSTVPFQRWYPYIEGYSMAFVEKLIADYCPSPTLIYEPFAGTGTTLFAADVMGCGTVWSEINPLLQFLIHTKLKAMSLNHEERQQLAVKLLDLSASVLTHCSDYDRSEALAESYESTFGKSEYFPREEYDRILCLRSYIDDVARHDQLLADLLTVGVVACLLPVSYMKKQGDVRFKTEKERQNMMALSDVLPLKLKEMASDLTAFDFYTYHSHRLITANAKHIGTAPEVRISDVITSPPYLNGTNYFRNTKLELWFMGILKNKAMLRTLRNEALTSGINDVLLKDYTPEYVYDSPLLKKTLDELQQHAYDARIPQMARCYFDEMSELFGGLRKHLTENANLLIDLGDSIFSGIHVRTDDILVEVLESLGYTYHEKVVLRQRRSRCGGMLSQVLLVIKYNAV